MEYKIDFEKINLIHPTDESKEKIRDEIKANKRAITAVYNGLNSHLEATCVALNWILFGVAACLAYTCFGKISQNHNTIVSILLTIIIALLLNLVSRVAICSINSVCVKIYAENLITYVLSDCIDLASQYFIAEDEKINLAMYYFTLYNTNFDIDKVYPYISDMIRNP